MKKYFKWMLLVCVIVCLSGCNAAENKPADEKKPDITEEKPNQKDGEKDEDTDADKKEDTDKKDEDDTEDIEKPDVEITVYYTDDNGDVQNKKESIAELTPENVWNMIKKENGMLSDSEMITCNVDESKKVIDLDLSKSFGDKLRSVGTSGENSMISVIVNTYLDAFECEQIKISEEGGLLSSSHRDYDKYMEKR